MNTKDHYSRQIALVEKQIKKLEKEGKSHDVTRMKILRTHYYDLLYKARVSPEQVNIKPVQG
jgi:hypothetical protein